MATRAPQPCMLPIVPRRRRQASAKKALPMAASMLTSDYRLARPDDAVLHPAGRVRVEPADVEGHSVDAPPSQSAGKDDEIHETFVRFFTLARFWLEKHHFYGLALNIN